MTSGASFQLDFERLASFSGYPDKRASWKLVPSGDRIMLNAVIRFSLRFRTLVIAAALVVLVYGGYLTTTLPIDVFPDLDRPRVVILTECPGLSPEEVETLVAVPIETAILGATGVETVRSQSSQGMVVVYVEFDWRTEIRYARQIVSERLANVVVPPNIRPLMAPPASIMGQFMHIGVHRQKGPRSGDLLPIEGTGLLVERIIVPNDKTPTLAAWKALDRNRPDQWEPVAVESVRWHQDGSVSFVHDGRERTLAFRTPLQDRLDLRTTADWLLRPRLLKIPGIAEVIIMGGDRKQYHVLIDPDKLYGFDVSLQEVEAAIKANNLNASGGFLEEGQGERPVRVIGRLGPLAKQVVDDLLKVPVKATSARTIPNAATPVSMAMPASSSPLSSNRTPIRVN
jgi:Cu/Ag efflux pump CusA